MPHYPQLVSVTVNLDELTGALAKFTFAYLVTVGDDYRAHTVAVDPVLTDGRFHVGGIGNSTRRNAAAHPDVTLVWPPTEAGGYTLIADGRADVTAAGLTVAPARAVLHRAATPGTPTASGCGDDCVPLER